MSCPEKENLHTARAALLDQSKSINILKPLNVNVLLTLDRCQRLNTISNGGRLLVIHSLTGLRHLFRQPLLDVIALAFQKRLGLFDLLCVIILSDFTDTRRSATLDMILQARA